MIVQIRQQYVNFNAASAGDDVLACLFLNNITPRFTQHPGVGQ